MAKISGTTFDNELIEIKMYIRRDCRLSKKAIMLLGMYAFKMAVGQREEDHDMCIHKLIDYVEHLENLEDVRPKD